MTNYSQSMRDALELVYTRNQEKIAELNEKMSSAQIAKLKKAYEPMRNKRISTSNADKLSKLMDKVGKDKEVLIQIVKADIPFVSQSAVTKLITKHNMKGAEINKFKEEFNIESVELDEKRDMSAPPVSAKVVEDDGFRLVMKFKDGTTEALPSIGKPSMQNLKSIVDKNILKNPKRKAWVPVVSAAMKKGLVKEEVDLDEKKVDHQLKIAIDTVKNPLKGKFLGGPSAKEAEKTLRTKYKYTDKMIAKLKEEIELDEAQKIFMFKTKAEAEKKAKEVKGKVLELKKKMDDNLFAVLHKDLLKKEEVEEADLDEGVEEIKKLEKMLKDLEKKKKKTPGDGWAKIKIKELIADLKSKKEEVEEAYEYGTTEYANHTREVTPGQEVDEASARADAKRSMRRDPSMRKQSPFSKDVSATDDDVKAASKNIIMQMRKAVSLRGKFPVQFADKKKIKIPADIAQAVQQKYNSFKKPADKEKFQAKVAKSYKDMLRALREEVQEEKTILDRIEEIIKENKNG
jgi:hypothetical protein